MGEESCEGRGAVLGAAVPGGLPLGCMGHSVQVPGWGMLGEKH